MQKKNASHQNGGLLFRSSVAAVRAQNKARRRDLDGARQALYRRFIQIKNAEGPGGRDKRTLRIVTGPRFVWGALCCVALCDRMGELSQ